MKRIVQVATAVLLLSVTVVSSASATRFISHRGESASLPENTMTAFRAAINGGADGFECDVYLTSDNEIVCIHDATTARTTDGNLTVATSTLAQLKALDAGSWMGAQFAGERIPTLSEALSLARDGFEIYVEIKCGTEIIPYLNTVITAEPNATPERVVFICFDSNVIAALRQQFPAYRAYWLSNSSASGSNVSPSAANAITFLQAMGANGLNLQDHANLDAGYVDAIKAAGFSFHVWTVNGLSRAAQLTAMGVETVTSDTGAAFALALTPLPTVAPPLVHWTFDDGTLANSGTGGSAYDGTLNGSATIAEGLEGLGLRFNGTRGYAALNHTFGDQGTVALWYKPTRFYDFHAIFDNDVHDNSWEMWIPNSGEFSFRINPDNSSVIRYGNLNSRHNGTNVWYHFAVTWDRHAPANGLGLYINGVRQGTSHIPAWYQPGNNVFFGGGNSGNTPADGVMDDVRVYDFALSDRQVQAVHAEIAAKRPVVHLMLDGTLENTGLERARYDATHFGDQIWTSGVNNKGQAPALTTTNDYMTTNYRLNFSGSVAMWCYIADPWYNYNAVFDNSVHADSYECWVNSGRVLEFRPKDGGTKVSYTLGTDGADRWYHIVCTWDWFSGNIVMYVNGVERARGLRNSTWQVPGFFYIGGGNVGNWFGNENTRGTHSSDVQVYETPLSAERVAEIYREAERRGGLIAHLPFNGTFEDVAGRNTVTVTGSPEFVKAQVQKGLSYTPASVPTGNTSGGSCVSVADVMGAHTGTIALWFYARSPWYNYQPLFDNTVDREYWESWIYNDGRLAFRVSNLSGGGATVYDLNNLRGPDNWYHIAWTWNRAAQETKLYVDGVLRATGTLTETGWVDPHPTLRIGSIHPENQAANGIWDEVRLYDCVLTEAEIQDLMIIPPPPPPKTTVILVK